MIFFGATTPFHTSLRTPATRYFRRAFPRFQTLLWKPRTTRPLCISPPHKLRTPLRRGRLSHSSTTISIALFDAAVQKQENHGQATTLSTPLSYFCKMPVPGFGKKDTSSAPLPMRFCHTFPLFLPKRIRLLRNIYFLIRSIRIPRASLLAARRIPSRSALPRVQTSRSSAVPALHTIVQISTTPPSLQ